MNARLAHIVLLTPRNDLSAADQALFASAFERAVRDIPAVRAVRVGRRISHGAGYESAAPPFEIFAMIEFDDVAGLQEYLSHPAHQQLGARFATDVSAAAVYDFEIRPVRDLLKRSPAS
jgi:hypothetical protein